MATAEAAEVAAEAARAEAENRRMTERRTADECSMLRRALDQVRVRGETVTEGTSTSHYSPFFAFASPFYAGTSSTSSS